ncbi:hypothetical protein [Naasia aerilata]|uniref:Late embryogenesis abundant protein n=1 Tax=Naasia aerilata TaxID=1162966 RepID=A0ABM8GF35_9MICO|nr:hypothetical protein [Naasia aerilata]BDZ46708.1 hypothetical protein GCM10025866_26170 [Naasia aerilata]
MTHVEQLPSEPPSTDITADAVVVEPLTADPVGSSSTGSSGKAGAAKEQAGQVAQGAADAGKHVAGVAKDEAANVASEAKTQVKQVASETKNQARDLLNQTTSQVKEQASTQQQKAASGIRTISDQLRGMSSNAESGVAQDLVGQAASRLEGVASWLEVREPGDLLDEVRYFAARRPGTFIAIAAVAGVVAGRLTRGVIGAVKDDKEAEAATSTTGYETGYETTGYVAPTSYTTTSTLGDVNSEFDPQYGVNEYGTGLGGSATGDVRP